VPGYISQVFGSRSALPSRSRETAQETTDSLPRDRRHQHRAASLRSPARRWGGCEGTHTITLVDPYRAPGTGRTSFV